MKYLLILFLLNCINHKSYIKDRLNDLGDIASFSIDSVRLGELIPFFGFKIDIGKVGIGLYSGEAIMGCKYSKCFSSEESVHDSSKTFLIFTNEHFFENQDSYYVARNKTYLRYSLSNIKSSSSEYGKIRIRAGIVFGFSFEVNLLEAIDLFTSFFGYDLLNDDFHKYSEKVYYKKNN